MQGLLRYGLLAALLLCAAIPAQAGIVHGRFIEGHQSDRVVVYQQDREIGSTEVDRDKRYSIYLDPGSYRFKVIRGNQIIKEGVIRSYEGASRQDIR